MDPGNAIREMWLDLGRYRLDRRALEDADFLFKYDFLNEEFGFYMDDIRHPRYFGTGKTMGNLKEKQGIFNLDPLMVPALMKIIMHSVMNIQQHAVLDDGNPYGIWLYRFDEERTFEFIALDRGPGFGADDGGVIDIGKRIKKGHGLGCVRDFSDALEIETNGFAYSSNGSTTERQDGKAINGCRLRATRRV
jgi:hypothetical protein